MKNIPLSQGKFAIVDDSWFDYLNQWKWFYMNVGYAARRESRKIGGKTIYMHRVICPTPKGIPIDHIDGNGINNRSDNLRPSSKSQNAANRNKLRSSNTSGYTGVVFDNINHKWMGQIVKDGKPYKLGRFNTPEEAAHAYDKKARELFGEFAKLNFKEGE